MKEIPVLSLLGPTCSGKTFLSYEVLEQFNKKGYECEIISADSRQVYKNLNIGSAKPTKEELNITTHHCIDILEPNQAISAGVFVDFATKALFSINKLNKIPILVGGAGLYVKALLSGLFNETPSSERDLIRKLINSKLKEFGKENLFEELKKTDSKAAVYYSDMNPSRVSRALEYYYLHNSSIVDDFVEKESKIEYPSLNFVLESERDLLYSNINLRTVSMFSEGLLEEVKEVLSLGFTKEDFGLKMIGYFEAIQVLENEMTELQAIESIQKRTRNYAKRQITWFRKEPKIVNVIKKTNSTAEEIVEMYLLKYRR